MNNNHCYFQDKYSNNPVGSIHTEYDKSMLSNRAYAGEYGIHVIGARKVTFQKVLSVHDRACKEPIFSLIRLWIAMRKKYGRTDARSILARYGYIVLFDSEDERGRQ